MISHATASAVFQLLAPNLCAAKCRKHEHDINQYEQEIDSVLRDAGFDCITFTYTAERITVDARDMWDSGRKNAFIFDRPTATVIKPEPVHTLAGFGNVARINLRGTSHLYRMGTDRGPLECEANTRTQAAALARRFGYTVNDCNMIG